MDLKLDTQTYTATYAWINYGRGSLCGWCNKPEAEIKSPNQHIENHDTYDYLFNYYTGSSADGSA